MPDFKDKKLAFFVQVFCFQSGTKLEIKHTVFISSK